MTSDRLLLEQRTRVVVGLAYVYVCACFAAHIRDVCAAVADDGARVLAQNENRRFDAQVSLVVSDYGAGLRIGPARPPRAVVAASAACDVRGGGALGVTFGSRLCMHLTKTVQFGSQQGTPHNVVHVPKAVLQAST